MYVYKPLLSVLMPRQLRTIQEVRTLGVAIITFTYDVCSTLAVMINCCFCWVILMAGVIKCYVEPHPTERSSNLFSKVLEHYWKQWCGLDIFIEKNIFHDMARNIFEGKRDRKVIPCLFFCHFLQRLSFVTLKHYKISIDLLDSEFAYDFPVE